MHSQKKRTLKNKYEDIQIQHESLTKSIQGQEEQLTEIQKVVLAQTQQIKDLRKAFKQRVDQQLETVRAIARDKTKTTRSENVTNDLT